MSDQFLYHETPKMAKKLPYNLHGWAFYKIEKFPSQNFGQTQNLIPKLTRISTHKLLGQIFTER